MPAARKHPRVSRYESMLVNLSPARSFVDGVQCRLSLRPVTWPLAVKGPDLAPAQPSRGQWINIQK
ncbi:uncharacterized protein BO87DRAFT_78849 [Aspergillus neoniger CBS 115656]|uniref:Uncharacterized protein n=1 Tax=Aspergillus neoniger (strain CBS 115656) TaxID=1448310 RepID=A0A318ZU14_ASPNB|nr:hypothetical protein BO87DRAFT_78849 [Aspergillus neoniger CBS 115656]PYH39212.1 hypothetical protein BO87DRAFT_78849 [Aspergillus neoniger CBS 115656]